MDIAAQNGLRKCEPMPRYYNYAEGDYLEHFGIKHRSGRYKWGSGERPFQGEGGVKEGKDGSKSGLEKVQSYFEPDLKEGKGRENKSVVEKASQQASNAIDSVSAANRSYLNYQSAKNAMKLYNEAKEIPDDELRAIINRRNLERQYVQVMNDPATEIGYARADLILRGLSTGATVVGAGATVYSAARIIHNRVHNK